MVGLVNHSEQINHVLRAIQFYRLLISDNRILDGYTISWRNIEGTLFF